MSAHLQNYLHQLGDSNPDLITSIKSTVDSVINNHLKKFNYKEHLTGLLLGNVQSGKTGQMFGIAAAAADKDFQIFVLLTTDNVYLHEQTFRRALNQLDSFNVCGENDELRFTEGKLRKPILLILKKNTNILQKWRNNLSSSQYCEGRPIFVMDDEADAASLNTKINKNDISQINKHLDSIKKLASSSIYIQVTATPQAIILQTNLSGWKPSFVHYFKPGKNYLGGDFFYSEPPSYTIKFTNENELDDLRQPSEFMSEGLKQALMSFWVTCAHTFISAKGKVCNFLIHPSVRIADHEVVADKIGEYLNLLLASLSEKKMKDVLNNQLKNAWLDLQRTKPDILNFDDVLEFVHSLLDEEKINIIVMNSQSSQEVTSSDGINIIVGGNSLGRGVTFPVLQTVYYCRKSKTPQADTFWQHCRMFGYDRDAGLMRIYIPPLLLKLFTDLNNANRTLIEQINTVGIDEVSLLYPPKIKPTRANVIHQKSLSVIVGGVDCFPNFPKQKSADKLDSLTKGFDDKKNYHQSSYDIAIEFLQCLESEHKSEWNNKEFINCLKALKTKRPNIKVNLIIRRGRDIAKGTGTLLSPNDRDLGKKLDDSTVLTLYRIKGDGGKGWAGNPLWIGNIKLPKGLCFYKTED